MLGIRPGFRRLRFVALAIARIGLLGILWATLAGFAGLRSRLTGFPVGLLLIAGFGVALNGLFARTGA